MNLDGVTSLIDSHSFKNLSEGARLLWYRLYVAIDSNDTVKDFEKVVNLGSETHWEHLKELRDKGYLFYGSKDLVMVPSEFFRNLVLSQVEPVENCMNLPTAIKDQTISFEVEKPKRSDIDAVVEAWNEKGVAAGFLPVKRLTTTTSRGKMLVARIREYSADDVLKAIDNACSSRFLRESNFFDFGWFVRPNNFIKVLEGKYNDKTETQTNYNDDISGYE